MNIVLKSTQMIQKLFSVIFKLIFLKYFIQDVKNNKSFKPRQKNNCNRRATDSLDFGYLGKPYNVDTELYDYGFRDL